MIFLVYMYPQGFYYCLYVCQGILYEPTPLWSLGQPPVLSVTLSIAVLMCCAVLLMLHGLPGLKCFAQTFCSKQEANYKSGQIRLCIGAQLWPAGVASDSCFDRTASAFNETKTELVFIMFGITHSCGPRQVLSSQSIDMTWMRVSWCQNQCRVPCWYQE